MRSAAGPSPLLPCTVAVVCATADAATMVRRRRPAFVVHGGGVVVLFSGMASMEQQQQQLYTNDDSASVVLFDSPKNATTSNDASKTCVGQWRCSTVHSPIRIVGQV
jgi:hypothetical protein